MCGLRKSRKSSGIMDVSLLENIIRQCSSFFLKPKLHFSGLGEPLLYFDAKRIMRLCREKGMIWSMTTNGHLLEEYGEDFVQNDCYALNISIHGSELKHNRIVGKDDSFEKIISGIKKLDEIKRAMNRHRPLLALNCVINNHNVDDLKKVLNILIELPANSVTFQHLIFSESDLPKKEAFLITEKEKLKKLIEFITFVNHNKFAPRVNFYPNIKTGDIFGYYLDRNYNFNESCILPWLTVRIYPNGDVGLCNNYIFGNLNTHSLKEIINNKQAQSFREMVRRGKFKGEECFRCCHKHYY